MKSTEHSSCYKLRSILYMPNIYLHIHIHNICVYIPIYIMYTLNSLNVEQYKKQRMNFATKAILQSEGKLDHHMN